MHKVVIPLVSLQEGEEGIIQDIKGGRGLVGRLASLGVTSGMKIKVVRNIGGPLIIATNGTKIAIGRGQALKIFVQRGSGEAAEPDISHGR